MKLHSREKLRKSHRTEKYGVNGSCFEQGPVSDSLWSILFDSRPFRRISPEIISDDSRRLQKANQRLQSMQRRMWIRKYNLLNYFLKGVNNRWTFRLNLKAIQTHRARILYTKTNQAKWKKQTKMIIRSIWATNGLNNLCCAFKRFQKWS